MAGGGGGRRPGGASRASGRHRGLVGWAGVRAGSARTVAASRPANLARLGAGNGKALVSPQPSSPALRTTCGTLSPEQRVGPLHQRPHDHFEISRNQVETQKGSGLSKRDL